MRIVFVTPKVGNAFGQERVLKETCRLLKADGHRVFIIAELQLGEQPVNHGVFLVDGISSLHSLSDPRTVARRHAMVLEHLARLAPDVVHFFDQFDARLLRAVCRAYPTFFTAHTVAPTCPASTRMIPGGKACEKKSGWACVWHHQKYGCLDFTRTPLHRLHAVQNFRLRQQALREMRGIVAISDYVKNTLVNDGFPASQVTRLYNPVPIPDGRPDPDIPALPSGLIVTAARLVSLKGIDWLIRALKPLEAPDWRLWILGDGEEKENLQTLRDRLGLTARIEFRGRTTYAETQAILGAAEIVVQTNLGPEGFGLSIAEASALGKPVVTFDVPAFDELIRPGETGYLVPVGDLAGLSSALEKLIGDADLRREMGKRGRELVAEKFSPRNYLAGLRKLYGVPGS